MALLRLYPKLIVGNETPGFQMTRLPDSTPWSELEIKGQKRLLVMYSQPEAIIPEEAVSHEAEVEENGSGHLFIIKMFVPWYIIGIIKNLGHHFDVPA